MSTDISIDTGRTRSLQGLNSLVGWARSWVEPAKANALAK